MEPPVKRRRLGEPPHGWDRVEAEDEWEEYDGDDDSESVPVDQIQGSIEQDDDCQLAIKKAYANDRFRATMARICKKYGCDFEGIGDEIDLATGEIVVNNGHIENMRHEVDVGIPGDEDHSEVEFGQDEQEGKSAQESENTDDSAPLEDVTDHNLEDAGPKAVHDVVREEIAPDNQPWATDTDDTDAMADYMQLQGPYPDPDGLDGVPVYDNGAVAEEGPSLLSGLYDGGGLRYTSSSGPYGASPFALGPWEMLPSAHEYGFAKPNGFASAWGADYRFVVDKPAMRSLSNLSSPSSSSKRQKGTPSSAVHEKHDLGLQETVHSANLFEQHPEEASAFSESIGKAAIPDYGRADSRTTSSDLHSNMARAAVVDDYETVQEHAFSSEDVETSSQTGDDIPTTNQVHSLKLPSRVIPDSQDTCITQEDGSAPAPAQTVQASYNKSFHQDFDSACMLSDDETPLFTVPSSATVGNHSKVVGSVGNPVTDGVHDGSYDYTTVKRRRGRPRKYPRPDSNGQSSATNLRKTEKSTSKPPSSAASQAAQQHPFTGNINLPSLPSNPVPGFAWPSQAAQANETGAHLGHKRKRGRPRKTGTPQQQLPPSFIPYPAQIFGQPYFYPPYHFNFQAQSFHHPFHPMMQQPFQGFPQQMAYTPVHGPFFQQPLLQWQQQTMQRPGQQLLQQPLPSSSSVEPGQSTAQEPVKRKRGRPRKYPVGYKRCRRKVQMPGLQNSMTALLGAHPNRTPVTEDAWYGVARRLAQDISSLQGGFMLGNGFQAQAQAYGTMWKRPLSSPRQRDEAQNTECSSEEDSESQESRRVTELLDTSKGEELSSMQQSLHSSQADGSECPGSPGSIGKHDDAGFLVMDSPKSVRKPVEPTPSPPSPPSSVQRLSPPAHRIHPMATPTPVRTINSRTPTPIQAYKSRTPISNKSDELRLPSSPIYSDHGIAMGLRVTPNPTAAGLKELDDEPQRGSHVEAEAEDGASPDIEEQPILNADDDALIPVEDEDYAGGELAELQIVSSDGPTAPAEEASPTIMPSTPRSKQTTIMNYPLQNLVRSCPSTPPAKAASISAASASITGHASPPGRRTPTASPSLFVSSPVQASPRTPDKPRSKPSPALAVTPQRSPARRKAMVPRSTERCTPIFLNVEEAPPKWPNITEKRTMGEFRQAIIAPKAKAQEAKPQAMKQMSLKSMFTTHSSGKKHMDRKDDRPSCFTAAEPQRPSAQQQPVGKLPSSTSTSTSTKTHKAFTTEPEVVKDKKRRKSRRSLLSLVSGSGKGSEVDEADELGSPVASRSSSKARQSLPAPTTTPDARKRRKSAPRTTEHPARPERETDGPREKRKRRRHADGHRSKRAGDAASDVQECGVNGYTCNRDFCFTCL